MRRKWVTLKYYFNGEYYNGINTIKQKSQYVVDNKIGGIMIWELAQDAVGQYSLLTAINGILGSDGSVNQPPSAVITAPYEGEKIQVNSSVSITALANDNDGQVIKVEFFVDAIKIGEDLTSPFSFNWIPSLGNHEITVKATDNEGAINTSSAVSIFVTDGCTAQEWSQKKWYDANTKVSYKGRSYMALKRNRNQNPTSSSSWKDLGKCGGETNQSPSVLITSPSSGSVYNEKEDILITAEAKDPDGTVSMVEFFANDIKIGEAPTDPYTFTWSEAQTGTYSLTAKVTDNNGSSATSDAVNLTVKEITTGGCSSPIWSEKKWYNTGDKVSHLGHTFRSLFRNRNQPPAISSSWEDLGTCDGGETNESPLIMITSPSFGAIYNEGESIVITTNASDPDGSIIKVEFFADGIKIGEDMTSPFNFTWSEALIGAHSLLAIATDNKGGHATSNKIDLTVKEMKADDCTYSAWETTIAYSGGDKVSSKGNAYEANWWTQGEDPNIFNGEKGSGQPWTNLGPCDATSNPQSAKFTKPLWT